MLFSGSTVHDASKLSRGVIIVRHAAQATAAAKAAPKRPIFGHKPRKLKKPKVDTEVKLDQQHLHLILPQKLTDLSKITEDAIVS